MKRLHEIYSELEWIPEYLSRTVHGLEKISFQQDDLKQELRLKLWESLTKYWELVKAGRKPRIDIRRYCHTACLNKRVDFIRMTATKNRNTEQLHLSEEISLGKLDIDLTIEINEDVEEDLTIRIDGEDILDCIPRKLSKMIFKDHILGFKYEEIAFAYGISKAEVTREIFLIRKTLKAKYFDKLRKYFDIETLFYIERDMQEEDNPSQYISSGSPQKERKEVPRRNKVMEKHYRRIKNSGKK